MRKALFGAAALAIGLFTATSAQAAAFTFNFCGFAGDSSTCPADVTEASITFTEIADGDVNDYDVTVTIIGGTAFRFIDAIDFSAGIDFASAPVLTSAPAPTALGDWDTAFDSKVNANGCGVGGNAKFACSEDTVGNGPDRQGTNTWIYTVDFAGSDTVDEDSNVNLRALFVDSTGQQKGILSPDGNFETTETPTTTGTPTTSGTPTTDGSVPEPALLSLLGIGLAGAAYRIRRKG